MSKLSYWKKVKENSVILSHSSTYKIVNKLYLSISLVKKKVSSALSTGQITTIQIASVSLKIKVIPH
jgi:hypothetical protein